MDIFGKLKDINNNEWHWWASTEENFFNMNPPIIRPLEDFLKEIRLLVKSNRPLIITESNEHLHSIQTLCRGINRIIFKNADAFPKPTKLQQYIFNPDELALLLVEIDSKTS